jgi:hypothetical protein
MNETILPTENPNVKQLLRATEDNFQVWKQTTSTSGELPTGEGETTETITITRRLLTSLS